MLRCVAHRLLLHIRCVFIKMLIISIYIYYSNGFLFCYQLRVKNVSFWVIRHSFFNSREPTSQNDYLPQMAFRLDLTHQHYSSFNWLMYSQLRLKPLLCTYQKFKYYYQFLSKTKVKIIIRYFFPIVACFTTLTVTVI